MIKNDIFFIVDNKKKRIIVEIYKLLCDNYMDSIS